MLSVQRCRRLLGEEASHLTDEQVERIRAAMNVFADVAIHMHVSREQPDQGRHPSRTRRREGATSDAG